MDEDDTSWAANVQRPNVQCNGDLARFYDSMLRDLKCIAFSPELFNFESWSINLIWMSDLMWDVMKSCKLSPNIMKKL